MITKTNLHKLKKCATLLKQAEYSHNVNKVRIQMKRNYHTIIHVVFSRIKSAVSLHSPSCDIEIMQGTKPIIGMNHSILSEHEKAVINSNQTYLDDLDKILSLNDNLAIKSNLLIKEYIYIFFDLQQKTRHYICYFSSKSRSLNPAKYHPQKTFDKKRNQSHKFILLHTDISVVNLIKGDSDSKIEETFSYIPKSIFTLWQSKQ